MKLPVLEIQDMDPFGWGTININGFTVNVNAQMGSIEIFVESGYAACMTGETYGHPMTAVSDYGPERVHVEAGTKVSDLSRRVKVIVSHPETITVRLRA